MRSDDCKMGSEEKTSQAAREQVVVAGVECRVVVCRELMSSNSQKNVQLCTLNNANLIFALSFGCSDSSSHPLCSCIFFLLWFSCGTAHTVRRKTWTGLVFAFDDIFQSFLSISLPIFLFVRPWLFRCSHWQPNQNISCVLVLRWRRRSCFQRIFFLLFLGSSWNDSIHFIDGVRPCFTCGIWKFLCRAHTSSTHVCIVSDLRKKNAEIVWKKGEKSMKESALRHFRFSSHFIAHIIR